MQLRAMIIQLCHTSSEELCHKVNISCTTLYFVCAGGGFDHTTNHLHMLSNDLHCTTSLDFNLHYLNITLTKSLNFTEVGFVGQKYQLLSYFGSLWVE